MSPITRLKTSVEMPSTCVSRIFKENAGRASEVESLFRKVAGQFLDILDIQDILAFFQPCQNLSHVHWYVSKSSFFRSFEKFILTVVADLLCAVFNAKQQFALNKGLNKSNLHPFRTNEFFFHRFSFICCCFFSCSLTVRHSQRY